MFLAKIKTFVYVLILSLLIFSCSKNGGSNPPLPPAEENLSIGIDPDPGIGTAKALGASYDFKLLINSKMPSQGVEGTIVFKKEVDNSVISSQNVTGSISPINITINSIALNEVGVVSIDIKSKSKPSNTASKTFKLSRK